MNWRKWAIALLSVLAIAMVAWLISAQAVGAAPMQEGKGPAGCHDANRSNRYVIKPVEEHGKVTHTFKDYYGNSYIYSPGENEQGATGDAEVVGYYVRGHGSRVWVYHNTKIKPFITDGQAFKVCINQTGNAKWGSWDWNVLSPALYP